MEQRWDPQSIDCNVYILTAGVVHRQDHRHTFMSNHVAAFELPGRKDGIPRLSQGDHVIACVSCIWKCRSTSGNGRYAFGFKEQHRFGWDFLGRAESVQAENYFELCKRMVWECDRLFPKPELTAPPITKIDEDLGRELMGIIDRQGSRTLIVAPKNWRQQHAPSIEWHTGCLAFAAVDPRTKWQENPHWPEYEYLFQRAYDHALKRDWRFHDDLSRVDEAWCTDDGDLFLKGWAKLLKRVYPKPVYDESVLTSRE